MRFLVTGCTSYIARYVIDQLLANGYEVIGISRSRPNFSHERFRWLQHDLSTGPCLIDHSVDVIVHMAAQSLLGKSAEEYLQSNILVTYHTRLMAEALNPSVLFFTSSMKVYGQIHDAKVDEQAAICNPDLYGLTKYYGERLLSEAVPTISLRLPGVIAPGSHGWIDKMYQALKRHAPISLFNSPYNHVVHASDIFGIINTLAQNGRPPHDCCYNVCAAGVSSSQDVVQQMADFQKSRSAITINSNADSVSHLISNERLLTVYQPLDVTATIALYLTDMQQSDS